jgi:hypothetical protein
MTRYPKGHIVKYEPTAKGIARANRMMEENPLRTAPVLKCPSHVELLEEFVFHASSVAHHPSRKSPISA